MLHFYSEGWMCSFLLGKNLWHGWNYCFIFFCCGASCHCWHHSNKRTRNLVLTQASFFFFLVRFSAWGGGVVLILGLMRFLTVLCCIQSWHAKSSRTEPLLVFCLTPSFEVKYWPPQHKSPDDIRVLNAWQRRLCCH